MSVKFEPPSYTFTYNTPLLDRLLATVMIAIMWSAAVFEIHALGFHGDIYSKVITSILLLYVIWHFVASRKPQEIGFSHDGMTIPDTWLPGLIVHHVAWGDIVDVDVSSKNRLPTICLYLGERKRRHIFFKGLHAYRSKRLVSRPAEKLFVYLCDVVGIVKSNTDV